MLTDADRRVTHIIATGLDVTEQRQTERTLGHVLAAATDHAIVAAGPDGVPVVLAAIAYGLAIHPAETRAVLGGLAVVLGVWLRRTWRVRRFRSTYVSPTVKAIRVPVGTAEVRLEVDRRSRGPHQPAGMCRERRTSCSVRSERPDGARRGVGSDLDASPRGGGPAQGVRASRPAALLRNPVDSRGCSVKTV